MLSDSVIEKLVNYFWDDISEMSYDDWCGTSSGDKESVVPYAIVDLGLEGVDIDEVYDLFWEWAEGLDEESFSGYEDEEEDESEDDEDYFNPDLYQEENDND
jgi:hypothetical protein